MLSQKHVEQFSKQGFLNAGNVLSDVEVADLGRELDRVIAIGPHGFENAARRPVLFRDLTGGSYLDASTGTTVTATPVWQIVNIWEVSEAFERLIHHPFIVKAISQLTGFADLQVWHDQVQYKPAEHGGATAWHQDAPLWPSIEPHTPVSAWLPLDDADEANGCMWMVPGSHQWGDHMQDYLVGRNHLKLREDFSKIGNGFTPPVDAPTQNIAAVPCPVKRGEVHFHHSLTWHGSPENHSPRPRRAIAIHYMTSEARYTGRQHAMQPFIEVEVGGPMARAGRHFPIVCRAGEPVAFGAL